MILIASLFIYSLGSPEVKIQLYIQCFTFIFDPPSSLDYLPPILSPSAGLLHLDTQTLDLTCFCNHSYYSHGFSI